MRFVRRRGFDVLSFFVTLKAYPPFFRISTIKILFLNDIGIVYLYLYLSHRYTYRYRIGMPIGIRVIGIYKFLNTEKEEILVILLSPVGLVF